MSASEVSNPLVTTEARGAFVLVELKGYIYVPPNYARQQTSSLLLTGTPVLWGRLEESVALQFFDIIRPSIIGKEYLKSSKA